MRGLVKLVKQKGIGDILLCVALVATIVGLIGYHLSYNEEFQKTLDSLVIIVSSITIALEVLGLIAGFKTFKYAVSVLSVYSIITFINTQTAFLGAALSGSDSRYHIGGWLVITVICYAVVFISSLVSGIMAKDAATLVTTSFKKEAE